MQSKKKVRRQLKKEFEQSRAAYAALQKRWEKGQAKTEKRATKLRKLAVDIADLESRLHKQHSESGEPIKDTDDSLRHARMIFKPTAGTTDQGAAQLKEIEERLRAHGIVAESVLKTSGKQVRAIAKEAADSKAELLLVAGGDGTIEDAAAQLIGSKTTLGIIPIGTMNNLARALGIPLEIEDACALLGMGLTREIDAGQVQTNATAHVDYFLESAGVGLSAIAIPAGQAAEKHHWHLLPNALRKLFSSQPANLSVELDDGQVIDAKSEVVTVSNSPLLGDNILIAPDAKMDDGLLDIAIYAGMGKTDLLGYFMAASKGKRAPDTRVVIHRARHVRISSDHPLDGHSDKDVIEDKQVLDIQIVPKALRVVAGKGVALTSPLDDVPSNPPLSGPQAKADDKPKEKEEDKAQPRSQNEVAKD
jgi:diacylglycerol kinase (ATP)